MKLKSRVASPPHYRCKCSNVFDFEIFPNLRVGFSSGYWNQNRKYPFIPTKGGIHPTSIHPRKQARKQAMNGANFAKVRPCWVSMLRAQTSQNMQLVHDTFVGVKNKEHNEKSRDT